ncbi:DUF2857 domain-containing protein [Citrobacter farmeri]|uniref:Coproporphyrinogen III oxidase n=1 Tax=Citrobacter amalonaticus Y19 TaxID=1261127 RepID=A0A0F6RG86_CITAM|nr:DUF2857 domain-containing protein [Citrobacter amalonaticus]AKE60080.1 hypothetical protein F384_16725 [Citrobacter amalonaticus Y19]EKV5653146.1 DUF2857 domain-containing protein [Citrobacter farmeri]
MMPTINQAVLSQVIQELKDGNVRYCEALGFDRDELNELNTLTFEELMHLGNTSAQFLKITINHDVLRKMLVQVRQEQKFQQFVGQAVQLGGSIALISHYFGISTAEISARRRLMGIHIRQGRNQAPDEAEEAALWKRWQEIKVDNLDSTQALEAMMQLAQERSLSLTVVWNLIRQWEKS